MCAPRTADRRRGSPLTGPLAKFMPATACCAFRAAAPFSWPAPATPGTPRPTTGHAVGVGCAPRLGERRHELPGSITGGRVGHLPRSQERVRRGAVIWNDLRKWSARSLTRSPPASRWNLRFASTTMMQLRSNCVPIWYRSAPVRLIYAGIRPVHVPTWAWRDVAYEPATAP